MRKVIFEEQKHMFKVETSRPQMNKERECVRCGRTESAHFSLDADGREMGFCDVCEQIEKNPNLLDPRHYHNSIGVCTACREHTGLLDPCCEAPVYFEGTIYTLRHFARE